jgi:TatD DNase family protein
MGNLVDFHCHLDLYPDFEALAAECERQAIYTLAVTTTPRAWPKNKEVASGKKYVRAALGLHPQLVATHHHEIALWERYLPEASYVGEVGLDGSPQYARSLPEQQKVFERILKACNEQGGKILSIPSVRTTSLILDMLERHLDLRENAVVLHWFTGSASEARRAASLGCYFSVNARMLSSPKGISVVSNIPPDRILTETDGPFTVASRGTSRPRDVFDCVRDIAANFGGVPEEVETQVRTNLSNMLQAVAR